MKIETQYYWKPQYNGFVMKKIETWTSFLWYSDVAIMRFKQWKDGAKR